MLNRDLFLPICLRDLEEINYGVMKFIAQIGNIFKLIEVFLSRELLTYLIILKDYLNFSQKYFFPVSSLYSPFHLCCKNVTGLKFLMFINLFNYFCLRIVKEMLLCNRSISAYCDMISQITAILQFILNALNALRFISKQAIYFLVAEKESKKVINERNAEHQVSLIHILRGVK